MALHSTHRTELPLPRTRHRSGTMAFFILVFGSTWLFQLPAILAERGQLAGPAERFAPWIVLGFFAPLLFALGLCTLEGRGALRSLFRPLSSWRVNPGWYALALALPCVIFVVARALAAAVSGKHLGPWVYPPQHPQQLAALLLIPFTEQIPWRGYVYPRLERARGPLVATLITGFAWGLFHVQKHLYLDAHASIELALLTLAYMTAGTIVFSWLYLRTGGSMLLVVVAHMGAYLNNPTAALPTTTPLALHTLGYCLVALALLGFDRRVWLQGRPRESITLPP